MLLGTILLVSLIIGLLGMVGIIVGKLIVLRVGAKSGESIAVLLNKSRQLFPYQQLGSEKILKKILIRTKIVFLRGENAVDVWLERISSSKKFSDDYWKKIKKNKK